LNAAGPQSLPRRDILRRRADIIATLAIKPVRNGALSTFFLPTQSRRAAFFVPKRIGNAAVRNKHKRRMREIYRRMRERFPQGGIIFRLRHPAEFNGLCRDFERTAAKLADGRKEHPDA